jgi:hypothetical protein
MRLPQMCLTDVMHPMQMCVMQPRIMHQTQPRLTDQTQMRLPQLRPTPPRLRPRRCRIGGGRPSLLC